MVITIYTGRFRFPRFGYYYIFTSLILKGPSRDENQTFLKILSYPLQYPKHRKYFQIKDPHCYRVRDKNDLDL